MKTGLARLANRLYDGAPRLHRLLYGRYKQWSDRAERAVLAQLVQPGMTVFDVGANIGIYTEFLAALVGPAGKVVAFEPEPRNVARLQAAAAALPQVQVIAGGVGAAAGTIRLYVADDLNVDHRTYAPRETGRRAIDVPAVRLDDYAPPGGFVGVIKMDIQGAELGALRGATRLLGSARAPALLLEYWPYGLRSAGEEPERLLELLRDHGYRVDTIDGGALPASGSNDPDDYTNVLAVRH